MLTNVTKAYAHKIRDRLHQFLKDELHLDLNMDKTRVTHAKDGFDFLGFHIQWVTPPRNKPWLRITPSDKNIERLKAKIRDMTAGNRGFDAPDHKIAAINMVTRGWIYYYRHCNVKRIANRLDFWIAQKFTKWAKRKHNKGGRYVWALYWDRGNLSGCSRWLMSPSFLTRFGQHLTGRIRIWTHHAMCLWLTERHQLMTWRGLGVPKMQKTATGQCRPRQTLNTSAKNVAVRCSEGKSNNSMPITESLGAKVDNGIQTTSRSYAASAM
jgi:hypothetical protein